jgi:ribosomal protein S13
MKSNYLSASTIVEAILLKEDCRKFDVKINLNGTTYLAGVTTRNGEELADSYDFSRLPKDLSDEQIEEITDKISETLDDFSMEKSKHIRDNKDEIDNFYKGLRFFDNTLEEAKNIPSPTKTELKETTLRMILEKVDASELELFKWYLKLKEPTLSDISMAIEQLNYFN